MYIILLSPASLKGQIVTIPYTELGQIIVYLACDEEGYVSFDCSHRNLHLGIPVSPVRFRPFFPLICEILILLNYSRKGIVQLKYLALSTCAVHLTPSHALSKT